MILFTIITSLFFQQVSLRCSFAIACPTCLPTKVDTDPFFVETVEACPYLNGQELCCSPAQDEQMKSNFQAIDATFGSGGAGCDICAANLKRFWCEYTCSPRQSEFMTVGDYTDMPDPLSPSKIVTVQLNQLRVHIDTACQFWQSCKRTQFASQVSAMQTPGGFFNFQGENAVSQAKQYITSIFLDDPQTTLNLTDAPLCNYIPTKKSDDGDWIDPFGFKIKELCSCNNCDLSCSADNTTALYVPTGVFEGFNLTIVLSVWGSVLFISLVVTAVKYFLKKKKQTSDYDRVPFEQEHQGH